MILTAHLLFGAAIASFVQNPILAIIAAFLGHFFLDFIPHAEYSIKNIVEKNWKRSLPDFLRVVLDFCVGILLISIFSTRAPIIFVAAFFAILPDGLSFLISLSKAKKFESYNELHQKEIHFFKYKKISNFWRILSQVIVVFLSILLLV